MSFTRQGTIEVAQLSADRSNAKGFYPTPIALAHKMLARIEWGMISSVLEPSAGKGDLAEAIVRAMGPYKHGIVDRELSDEPDPKDRKWVTTYRNDKAPIDCIEIDQNLRHILSGKKLRVVHDDFLTFQTNKRYDLIVMNPPFDRGDEHLLHALQLLEPYGGCVVCLLNVETLRNSHTNRRDLLRRRLDTLNAEIEYVSDAFKDAERSTGVEIAIVKAVVSAQERPSVILGAMRKDQVEREERATPDPTAIAKGDFIQAIIDQYDFEVRAGLALIHEYAEMQPLLLKSIQKEAERESSPIMSLIMGSRFSNNLNDANENAYIQAVRTKYWEALFQDKRFTNQLTSNLVVELNSRVEQLKDYDFSLFNILELRAQMSAKMVSGVEQTILQLFDDWTHKWHYGEYSQNRHLFDGWKTNESYRVGKKVITPLYGHSPFSEWSDRYDPTGYSVQKHLGDIEKVFRFLDTGNTAPIDMALALEEAKRTQQTRKVKLTYFYVTFYKKGTLHIEFHDQDILHKFNLFGCQRKGWLPPAYGKKRYKDMDATERAVVDSFEGEASYGKVMERADYYLVEPNQMLLEVGA